MWSAADSEMPKSGTNCRTGRCRLRCYEREFMFGLPRAPGIRALALPAMAGEGRANRAEGQAHRCRFGAAGLLPVYRAADGEV